MRSLDNLNPITAAVYFTCAICIPTFSQNPVTTLTAVAASALYCIMRKCRALRSTMRFCLLFVVVMTVLNPLISHNGKTVLFFINDSPVTAEAAIYGALSSLAVSAVILFFRALSDILTQDKLLYVFGKTSPKTALVLSMALRYSSLLREKARQIEDSQTALGLYEDGNVAATIKGKARIFSVLVTWSLENGITTADSMASRGYGKHRRTYFSLFGFSASDAATLAFTAACTSLYVAAALRGDLAFACYPSIAISPLTPLGAVAYTAYALLALFPVISESGERLKWKYLRSKI